MKCRNYTLHATNNTENITQAPLQAKIRRSNMEIHTEMTHTHTHTYTERGRERERESEFKIQSLTCFRIIHFKSQRSLSRLQISTLRDLVARSTDANEVLLGSSSFVMRCERLGGSVLGSHCSTARQVRLWGAGG